MRWRAGEVLEGDSDVKWSDDSPLPTPIIKHTSRKARHHGRSYCASRMKRNRCRARLQDPSFLPPSVFHRKIANAAPLCFIAFGGTTFNLFVAGYFVGSASVSKAGGAMGLVTAFCVSLRPGLLA